MFDRAAERARAETLPDEHDAAAWKPQLVLRVVDDGDAVGDESGLGGGAGGAPEAAVVEGEDVGGGI